MSGTRLNKHIIRNRIPHFHVAFTFPLFAHFIKTKKKNKQYLPLLDTVLLLRKLSRMYFSFLKPAP
eukprot:m.125468 g.125468  ORF g.125468 m.125468 type:complete len:66 (-) comp17327_c0_seq2:745-942(-)